MPGATHSHSMVTVPATLIEGLERDRDRLDWIEANEVEMVKLKPVQGIHGYLWQVHNGFGSTLREAIDNCMKSEAGGGE